MKNHLMRLGRIAGVLLLAALYANPASAKSGCSSEFNVKYPNSSTNGRCATCHYTNSNSNWNPYGQALRSAGANCGNRAAFNAILTSVENLDSDGEGTTNLEEISANAQPGWCVSGGSCSNPVAPPGGILLDPPSTNSPPVVNAGGTYSGVVGVALSFNKATATDADGDTLSYSWAFGDGGTSNLLQPTYIYNSAQQFTATLTVNDGTVGVSSTATVTIAAANNAPTATVGGPYIGEAGTPVGFAGLGFDADGDTLTYTWNFGDGTAAGTGTNPMHTYGTAGTYTVSLTVNDGKVNSAPSTTNATITAPPTNTAPTANAGGPYNGTTGANIAFSGAGSTDPNGDALTYQWEFGDGASASGVSPSHAFASANTYTVTLTVQDPGSLSNSTTTTATIADPAQPSAGEVLYASNCQGCHGDPWASPAYDDTLAGLRRMAGARECTINASINGTSVFPGGVPDMQGMQGMIGDVEAAELATYLNSQAVTGEQRYITSCAGCHGADGTGGRSQISVLGLGAGATAAAIANVNEMAFLACLPDSDVAAVEGFLLSKDVVNPPPVTTTSGGGGGAFGWIMLLVLLAGRAFPLVSRRR
jgi:PKD repeat protein